MKLGIMSDTHNHTENTQWALDVFRNEAVERIIHCGDITTPPIIKLFEGWNAIFVFGNIDRNHAELMVTAKEVLGMGTIGYTYAADLDGIRVAACHGHITDQYEGFVNSGQHDYVFFGHTHLRADEKAHGTRVINPGALGGKHVETRSVCVLDTATGEARFIELA